MSVSFYSGQCNVYLCSTPIQQSSSAKLASSSLSFVASSSKSLCGDSWNKHWLVVFDYGADELLICDADSDAAGELTGRRCWKKRAAFEKSGAKTTYLGNHNVPEWLLDKALKKMCDSGPYHLTKNNCQTWALGLLRELGIKPPDEEHPAEEVVNDVFIPGAAIGGAAIFVAFLAALILGGTRRNNRD